MQRLNQRGGGAWVDRGTETEEWMKFTREREGGMRRAGGKACELSGWSAPSDAVFLVAISGQLSISYRFSSPFTVVVYDDGRKDGWPKRCNDTKGRTEGQTAGQTARAKAALERRITS